MKEGNEDGVSELLEALESKTRQLKQLQQLGLIDEGKSRRSSAITPSRIAHVPTGLPLWKSSTRTTRTDCKNYLDSLEDAFNAERFPEQEAGFNRWVSALLKVMSDNEERTWVRRNLVEPNLSWKEARTTFTTRFARVRNFLAGASELKKLKKGSKSLPTHIELFSTAMKESLNRDDEEQSCVSFDVAQREPIYSLLFIESLNQELGEEVMGDKRVREVTDLHSLMVLAEHIENEMSTKKFYSSLANAPSRIGKPQHGAQRREISRNVERSATPKAGAEFRVTCHRCGRDGHKRDACYSKKHKDGRNLEAPTARPLEARPLGGFQAKEQDKKTLVFAAKKTGSVRRIRTFEVVTPDVLAPCLLLLNPTKCEASGVRKLAVVDTGSFTSAISLQLCREMGAEHAIKSDTSTLQTFGKGVTVDTVGMLPIRILCGRHVVDVDCPVVDMLDEFLMGRDLLPRFGIGVMGLPTAYPDNNRTTLRQEAEAEELPLRERSKPWSLEDEIDTVSRQKLLDGIQTLLDENANLDPLVPAFRDVAESIMAVPTRSTSFRRQYPIPHQAMELVDEHVKKWLEKGRIKEGSARSNFNTSILLVSKKDAEGRKTSTRAALDFRHINQLLVDDEITQEIPRPDELIAKLKGLRIGSALDLQDAYGQCRLKEEDQEKTTFTWRDSRYMWQRWPAGLKPAVGRFQKVMEIVLQGVKCVIIFLDDLLIYTLTDDVEEHIKLVRQVLTILNYHNCILNIGKCRFGFKRVLLLGHYRSGDSTAVDPLKAELALNWEEPKTGKQMQAFLGFVNFVRNYIPLYQELTEPLVPLTQVKRFTLTEVQRKYFTRLKEVLNSTPVLSDYNPDLTLHLAADTSQGGIGGVLYQLELKENANRQSQDLLTELADGNVKVRFIAFVAKALAGAQKNYPATKRELLGIVWCLRKLHVFLWGIRFYLYTDHSALLAIDTKDDLSYVMLNWLDTLLDYDFTLVHIPGVLFVLPDCLSRMFCELREQKGRTEQVRRITLDPLVGHPEHELREFINERLAKTHVADAKERRELLLKQHTKGHFGAEKLYKALWYDGFYWPGMRKQCGEVVNSCRACLQYNVGREGFHPVKSLRAEAPWDHVAVDCIAALPESRHGYKHVLLLVDIATRFLVTQPLRDMTMETLAASLYKILMMFGPMKIMQSDNGSEFVNQLLNKLTKLAGVDHRRIAEYNPRANGLAERSVQTVKLCLLKRLEGEFEHWDVALQATTYDINHAIGGNLKSSPFTLFFGRRANNWKDYSQLNMLVQQDAALAAAIADENKAEISSKADKGDDDMENVATRSSLLEEVVGPAVREAAYNRQDKKNEILNKKRKAAPAFKVGSLVMLRDQNRKSKLEPRWVGPYVINLINQRGTFQLKDLTGTILQRVVPVAFLKLCGSQTLTDASGGEVKLDEPRFVVEKILDVKEEGGRNTYLVKWEGYPASETTWEPAEHFEDASTLANFWRQRNPARKRKAKKLLKNTKKKQNC